MQYGYWNVHENHTDKSQDFYKISDKLKIKLTIIDGMFVCCRSPTSYYNRSVLYLVGTVPNTELKSSRFPGEKMNANIATKLVKLSQEVYFFNRFVVL